jgi:hypothetical protein
MTKRERAERNRQTARRDALLTFLAIEILFYIFWSAL